MTDAPGSPAPIRRAILWVLGVQVALALLLFLGDLGRDFALPRIGPGAPAFDQPVSPGDQTRRYRPGDLPVTAPADTAPSGPLPDRLTLTRDGDDLLLRGAVEAGDAERIIRQITAQEGAARVVLDSPGGSVMDALAIGRAIRAEGLASHVTATGICLSACPYLLAGGTARSAEEGARIGVHQHYFGENTLLPAFAAVSDIQRGQAEVMRYLDQMGIDPMLMAPALATPPDQIYLLLRSEMLDTALLTEDAAPQ
ncbi:MAG: putative periplasmic protein [Rhodobacteraceae bacterium HLUCCA08]|nr:MAG: putative periplasmic protein [Rhodobacteraceae bacterium HLUCCA08]